MLVTLQPEDLNQRRIAPARLAEAVRSLREHGLVVLENAVPHDALDALREKMDDDSRKLIAEHRWGGAGHVPGHLQQGPPRSAPHVLPDIVSNPFVIQATRQLLGPGAFNSFYNGNTNCPGSGTQPLHMDSSHLWANAEPAHPAASVVVNFGLMDISEEHGSIELWPGSHRDLRVLRGSVPPEIEEARRKTDPPIRGNAKKGSVLIRDMRLWHRGTPNRSKAFRHMIALVHNVSWLRRERSLRFEHGCETAFADPDFDHNVQFTDAPIDYLADWRS